MLHLDRVEGGFATQQPEIKDTPTGGATPTDSAPDTPLVHVTVRDSSPTAQTDDGRAAHRDEGQVGLDTRRSFVTYPKGWLPSSSALTDNRPE